jgi:hypothetical protein
MISIGTWRLEREADVSVDATCGFKSRGANADG